MNEREEINVQNLTFYQGSTATGLLTLHLGDIEVTNGTTANLTAGGNLTTSGNLTTGGNQTTNVTLPNDVTGLDFRATHYKCAAVNETEWIISAYRSHPLTISVLTLENLNASVTGVKRANNSKEFLGIFLCLVIYTCGLTFFVQNGVEWQVVNQLFLILV